MPYKNPEKQKEYQRLYVARKRREWLQDKVCADCGNSENLQVDHIDRQTKTSHRIWSWSETRREAELAKCQVLCTTCHKDKTAKEARAACSTEHGTTRMYKNQGCRCQPCTTAQSQYNAEWRRKNGGRHKIKIP